MRSMLVFALLLLSPLAASAGWQSTLQEARGQTVWFNAWGAIRRLTAISTGSAVR